MTASVALSFLKAVTSAFAATGMSGIGVYIYFGVAATSGLFELRFLNKAMELFE
jgi:hypothetical protein